MEQLEQIRERKLRELSLDAADVFAVRVRIAVVAAEPLDERLHATRDRLRVDRGPDDLAAHHLSLGFDRVVRDVDDAHVAGARVRQEDLTELGPVDQRHRELCDQHRGRVRERDLERSRAVGDHLGGDAELLAGGRDALAALEVSVRDQNRRRHGACLPWISSCARSARCSTRFRSEVWNSRVRSRSGASAQIIAYAQPSPK